MAQMIPLPIVSIRLFVLAFGFYHAVLGVLNISNYLYQSYVWAALAIYAVGLVLNIFIIGDLRLPNWAASYSLIAAILIPILVSSAITIGDPNPYTTWYVAALGTLLGITAVRGHTNFAWIGVGFLIFEVLVWGGFGALFNSGLIGAVMLVLGAQASARVLAENEVLIRQFRERAISTEAATAAKSAARLERETRLKQTLSGVLPQLEMIVSKKGRLSAKERSLAILTEAELRDQIRGRNLSHPELISETRKARERGVEIQLLDDGGLDDLSEEQASALLSRAANELKAINTGKVVIRSVAGENWNLTIAAIRKGAEQPDLFLRL